MSGECEVVPEQDDGVLAGDVRDIDADRTALPNGRLVAIAAAFAAVGIPLESTLPEAGLDPSWQVGLALLGRDGLHIGRDFVFTYGPLGTLAVPKTLWVPSVVLGVAYALLAGMLLYLGLLRWLVRLTSFRGAVASTAAVMLFTAYLGEVPEMLTVGAALLVLERVRPDTSPPPSPPLALLAGLGALVGIQMLVKFNMGAVLWAVALAAALAAPRRLLATAVTMSAFVVVLLASWTVFGQRWSDLGVWLWGSLQVAAGYNSAMAAGNPLRAWLLSMLVVGAVLLSCASWANAGRRALPFILVVLILSWTLMKAAIIRFDPGHAALACVLAIVLAVVSRWRRPAAALVPAVVIALAALGVVVRNDAVAGALTAPLHSRWDAAQELVRASRDVVDASSRGTRLAEARVAVLAEYGIPDEIVSTLVATSSHVAPVDISAAWAIEHTWRPSRVLQAYTGYTPTLDTWNAESVSGDDRPQSVLVAPDQAIDDRVPFWESPSYQVALTCNYTAPLQSGRWVALRRDDAAGCGKPVLIGEVEVSPGALIDVPEPRDDSSLVVARFEVARKPVPATVGLLLRPLHYPTVEIDGFRFRFVPGTAGQDHLVSSIGVRGGLPVLWGTFSLRRIAFSGVDVTRVRFFEVPEAPRVR